MSTEGAGWRKLTEFVAYHVFRNINRNEFISIMHCERVADHFRCYCRSSGPCLDHRFFTRLFCSLYFLKETEVSVRSFLNRTSHYFFLLLIIKLSEYFLG